MVYKRVRVWLMKLRQREQLTETLLLKTSSFMVSGETSPIIQDMLCKYYPFYRVGKQSISKQMNNDDLKFTQHDQIAGLASPLFIV